MFASDKPENVQLQTSPQAQVCEGDMIMFNCSADAEPDVHTYELLENNMLLENSSTGEFHKNMSSRGVFRYKCVAINVVGSSNSQNSSITVNCKFSTYCCKLSSRCDLNAM